MTLGWPEVPFNPVTAPVSQPLQPYELLAGPLGLLLLIPFVPLLRSAARARPREALLSVAFLWLFATLGPIATAVFVGGTLAGVLWVTLLGTLRRRGALGKHAMIAGVWIGLNALALPLWWQATWQWYGWLPSRFAVFHSIGFAYVLLRLIAWGVDWAKDPAQPLRLGDTLCWLFYPPSLRNGPFLLRKGFLARLDEWDLRRPVRWKAVFAHFGMALVGLAGLGACALNVPRVPDGATDFFADPASYDTNSLLRVLYLVPLMVYCFLWSYNALALALGTWIGLPLETNFHWLPTVTSVRDFWRRWNITVGAWIRDYIYIPLGGNRAFGPVVYLASFGYCGIWHGAAWGFVAWPIVPVVAMSVQRRWDAYRQRRGWDQQPPSRAWLVCCWLLTMHLGVLTLIIFSDFEHMGLRLLAELGRRVVGLG